MNLYRPPRLTGKYLDQVLASRWLTAGPMCERFREAVAEKLKVQPNQIALAARATSGFQAVLDMLAHERACRDESACPMQVDMTDATFIGMRLAIRHAGMYHANSNPDICVRTDIGGARPAIDDHTRKNARINIHDACHSWLPDPTADFAILSCYPTKPVPGAEGGVVVCKDPGHAREIESWVSSGLTPAYNPTRLGGNRASVPGRETHLTDVAAALNLEALEVSDSYMGEIQCSWRKLAQAAEDWNVAFRAQPIRPYLFQIEVQDVPRVRDGLANSGIPSAWNFPPAPLVTLPCYPNMSRRFAELIIKLARENGA